MIIINKKYVYKNQPFLHNKDNGWILIVQNI